MLLSLWEQENWSTAVGRVLRKHSNLFWVILVYRGIISRSNANTNTRKALKLIWFSSKHLHHWFFPGTRVYECAKPGLVFAVPLIQFFSLRARPSEDTSESGVGSARWRRGGRLGQITRVSSLRGWRHVPLAARRVKTNQNRVLQARFVSNDSQLMSYLGRSTQRIECVHGENRNLEREARKKKICYLDLWHNRCSRFVAELLNFCMVFLTIKVDNEGEP